MGTPLDVGRLIVQLRGRRVMLSGDLARIYGVAPKVLVQAVKRHRDRFPQDFMFHLTRREAENLKSQIVTSSWGGARKPPHAFTEQGVAMLSSVLHSRRAVHANIAIMRTFVRVRELASRNQDLLARLGDLEDRIGRHDVEIANLIDAIRDRVIEESEPRRRIGFSRAENETDERSSIG